MGEVGADVVHVQAQPEFGAALKCPRVFTLHGVSQIDEWRLGGARRYITAQIKALGFWRFRKQYDHVIMISPYSHRVGGFRCGARLHDVPNPIEDRYFNVERGLSASAIVSGERAPAHW